jgi:hypothetical protein
VSPGQGEWWYITPLALSSTIYPIDISDNKKYQRKEVFITNIGK